MTFKNWVLVPVPVFDELLPCANAEHYKDHNNTLPTVEEFNAVWDVAWEDPPEESAAEEIKASYKKRRGLFSWCVESWLPRCVDDKWHGQAVRPRERVTNKIDDGGDMRERVSATREGYGFIQFENSRDSWMAKFKWDKEQELMKRKTGAKCKPAPNYSNKRKAQTKDFKCKWSDFGQGQQSKWDPVVYSELQLRIQKVMVWREKDAEKNCKGQDFAMKLSQEWQGLTEADLQPKTRKKRGRDIFMENDDSCAPRPEPKYFGYHKH